jgi:hypothetical protein
MSMIQLVVCSALGYLLAGGALYSIRHAVGWLQHRDIRNPIRALIPAIVIGRFIKYAAPVGAGAIVITLGAWAVGDYMAARAARSAAASAGFDTPAAMPVANLNTPAEASADSSAVEAPADPAAGAADPYADPDFKVPRRPHPAAGPASLKEKLLQRSEAKARADLLRGTQQHLQRSQYDCEAADRAAKYLKSGLDVWGFAAWQAKYFPTAGYRGTTLAQCKDIQALLDPSEVDLKSTVAQQNHP